MNQKRPPDSFFTHDGVRYRTTWREETGQFESEPFDAVSYGGGVQSTALLVLAAQRRIPYERFLFCNVGDDSENPDTLTYVRDVARPYAERNGLDLVELQRTRFGQPETLYKRLTRPGSRSIGIPVRMSETGAPGNRACTGDFKVKVVAKWLREHGATPAHPARVALGISLDEWHRARTASDFAYEELDYPLLTLKLDRAACISIIAGAGLPVPPKSACFFCPFHTMARWQEMRQESPDLFWRAAELEALLNRRRAELGLDPVWFTRKLKPLEKVTTELVQASLFDEEMDVCESGYCMM